MYTRYLLLYLWWFINHQKAKRQYTVSHDLSHFIFLGQRPVEATFSASKTGKTAVEFLMTSGLSHFMQYT
jgi:hypothetical protein